MVEFTALEIEELGRKRFLLKWSCHKCVGYCRISYFFILLITARNPPYSRHFTPNVAVTEAVKTKYHVTMTTYHTDHPSQCEPGCGIVRAIVKRRNVVIFIPGCVAFKKLRMSCRVQSTDRLRTERGNRNEYFLYGDTKTYLRVHSIPPNDFVIAAILPRNSYEITENVSLGRGCYSFQETRHLLARAMRENR